MCLGDRMEASSNKSQSLSRNRRCTRRILHFASLLTALASLIGSSNGQTISASPAASTSGAGTLSPILSPAYAGMGIEPTNLFSFTGTTSANQLSYNLLNNLANYTGVPPHLRIGGNSGDQMLYSSDSSYAGYQVYRNPNQVANSNNSDALIIGDAYFAAMDYFPAGTPITYGLNMAYEGSDFLDQINSQATASLTLLNNVSVVGFEIGNEPDLYVQNQYRAQGWTVYDYGNEWATRAVSVYNNVLKSRNQPTNFFEPSTTATTATNNGKPYRISSIVDTNVATGSGIYVAGWNQHDYYYYVGVSDYTLTLSRLVNIANTEQQFTEWQGQAQQALVTGKPYFLREMGSVGPTGLQDITDVFANTLWTFNFFLYAATLQISSVQMHMTSNSYASPWVPAPFADEVPHVRTTYYAWAAIDQIIGKSCTTRVAQLALSNVPSAYTNNIRAYTAYQGSTLRAIVLINTQLAYQGSTDGSVSFQLSMPSFAGQTLYVSALSAPGADAKTNTTWNGLSYEVSGTGLPTTVGGAGRTVQVGSDGTASISVSDSQAIVLATGQRLGTETNVDTSACSSLATNPEGGENVGGDTPTQSTAATFGSSSGNSNSPTFKATQGFAPGAAGALAIPPLSVLLVPCLLMVSAQILGARFVLP